MSPRATERVLRAAREPLVERAYCPHFILGTAYQVSTALSPWR